MWISQLARHFQAIGVGIEPTRQNKVEKSPKLLEVVLKRGTGDEESSPRVEGSDDLTEERIDVFDSVGLVNDDVFPRELLEDGRLSETHLVGSDANVEVRGEKLLRDDIGLW